MGNTLPRFTRRIGISMKNKGAIVTVSTCNRRDIYDITNPNKRDYAYMYGMDYRFSDDFDRRVNWRGHPYWLKAMYIRYCLKDYEWVLWMDDDAGIVSPLLNLPEFVKSNGRLLCATEDENGPNTGVMLFRNHPTTHRFLDWWVAESVNPDSQKGLYDQDAFIWYCKTHDNEFGILRGDIFNAHHPEFKPEKSCPNLYSPDKTFIVHIAGGPDRKKELGDRRLKEIFGLWGGCGWN